MERMNKILPRKQIALASCHDLVHLENGPLAGLLFFVDGNEKSALVLRDVFPLLAVSVSAQGETDIGKYLEAIRGSRTIPDVPTVRLEPETVDQAAELIRQVLEGSLDRLAAFTTSITGELAMLRRDREALLENYRALEDAFRARNWEGAAEVFAHDPFVDPKDEGIGQILHDTGVEQLLPVSSYGVSGFALHFSNTRDHGGELQLKLDCLESDESVGEWGVPFAEIRQQWNFFALPKACDGSSRTLRLRISANGRHPPEPSLGHPISNQRYVARAQVAHADLANRPLAFRVFTGLPGIRPTEMMNMLAPNVLAHDRRVVDYRPPTQVLSSVADVSVTPIVPDFEPVYFLENEAAIVCHPLIQGTSAGAIRGAVAPSTVRFSARVLVDHSEGSPAAVGLLLVAPTADLRAEVAKLGSSELPSQSEFFSGWREVTPQKPININVMLDTPLPTPMDLVVVSRAIKPSVDFCWLKFFDFRFFKESSAAA